MSVSIQTKKETYEDFEEIEVMFSGVVGEGGGWINVILASCNTSEYGNWKNIYEKEGSLTFSGAEPGEYETRIYDKDDNILAKHSFAIVAGESNRPLFTMTANTEHAKFAQVFKGTWDQSLLEVTLLRIGDKEENKYLVRFCGTIDHDWNGKIIPYRLEDFRDRCTYWTAINGQRRNTIQGSKKNWGRDVTYTAYLPDRAQGVALAFSEELSKEVNVRDMIEAYLTSLGLSTAIEEKKADTETLYAKIEDQKHSIRRLLQENTRIPHLESNIAKLEKEISQTNDEHSKCKSQLEEQIRELQADKSRLTKQLDNLQPKEEKTEKIQKEVNMKFTDHLSFRLDSYYNNGKRFQTYDVEFMLSNYEPKNDSIIDAEIDFWIEDKWQEGSILKDKFELPQKLEAQSPTKVFAAGEIASEKYLFPVILRVKFELFSGATIEHEVELKEK